MSNSLGLCAQEVRAQDYDRFMACLFAPKDKLDAQFAMILLFLETQRIRDLVSEPHLGLIRLQWWRDLIDAIKEGRNPEGENGTHLELREILEKEDLPYDRFDTYFNARSFDMQDQMPDDLSALIGNLSASTGEISKIRLGFLGCHDDISLEGVTHMAVAEGLAHIIRTLPHQARTGRLKIPRTMEKSFDLDRKALSEFICDDATKACMTALAREVMDRIAKARSLKLDKKALPLLLSSVAIEDYLKRLENVGYDPFRPDIGQGRFAKQIKMTFKAMLGRF